MKRSLYNHLKIATLAALLLGGSASAQTGFTCATGTKYKEYNAYANGYTTAVDVQDPEQAIGYHDGEYAELDPNETMIFTLPHNVLAGDTIFFWATSKDNSGAASVDVSVSNDGTFYSAATRITLPANGQVLSKRAYRVTHAGGATTVRFVSRGPEDLRIDAVGYSKWACAQLCPGTSFSYTSGTSVSVAGSNSIGGTDNAVGLPNDKWAVFNSTSDWLTLDLGTTIPSGAYFQLYASEKDDTKPHVVFQVTSSPTNSGFGNGQSFTTQIEKDGHTQYLYLVNNPSGVRYIRIAPTNVPGGQELNLVGTKYEYPTFMTGRSYVSGIVFDDLNGNGVKDVLESGAAGITVQLYNDVNVNGMYDPADLLVSSMATAAGGTYSFALTSPAANYVVRLDQQTLPASTQMTTDNVETASFTGLNQYDCNNNFGYQNCAGFCPPQAFNDFATYLINTPVQINVLDNDRGDYDPNSVIVGIGGFMNPSNGSVSASGGVVTYTPNFGFTGIDSFQYSVCGNFAPWPCDVATVVVNNCIATGSQNIIGGIVFFETMPDNNAYDQGENGKAGITVRLYNDANCNGIINAGDAVIATAVTNASGYYSFNVGTGCFITNIDPASAGGAYTASLVSKKSTSFASLGNCNNNMHLGVKAFVDAVNETVSVIPNNPSNILILANDKGVLNTSSVSTSGLLQPNSGTVVIQPNGSVNYTPDWGYIGADAFQYQVCSSEDPSVCDIATVTVNVACTVISGQNTIYGSLFEDLNISSEFDEGEHWTFANSLNIELYDDINNNHLWDAGDVLLQTVATDAAGNYRFNIANTEGEYLVKANLTGAPAGARLSTAASLLVSFAGANYASCSNDFGFAFCGSVCPPIARDDNETIGMGTALFLNVLNNDFDLDGNLVISSLQVLQRPVNGQVINNGNGQLVYAPNGSFLGVETFTYMICDDNTPNSLCDTATVTITITEGFNDPCAEATRDHTFYVPFPAEDLHTAFRNATSCPQNLGNVLRTVTSIKSPYPGTVITWDHWEDGYEADIMNPVQSTTQVWGDRDPSNGSVPGYATDFIPSVGNVVLDNEMIYSTRDLSHIVYDAKDKLYTTGDIALSTVSGDNSPSGSGTIFAVQAAKTDVYDINRFGTTFTVPFGENLGNEFQYTALFIRAAYANSIVTIDMDNDGSNDTTVTLTEGEVLFIDGGIQSGATVTSTQPVGLDVLFGGIDCFGTRQVNLLPGAFYADKYYTPVPTTLASAPAAVYLYNSLDSDISVHWASRFNTGIIVVPGKTTVKHVLSDNSAYRFHNPGGQSFTAIEVIDSDASGSTYDWAFNLISEPRLTNFASIAWAPGSLNGSGNYNPVWVTPTANTTIYVKYNGDLTDPDGLQSPCGIPYDLAVPLNELHYYQIFDNSDNSQSGVAVYTCDGTPISAVYGENPYANGSTTPASSPAMDVGTTIQPMCLKQLIIAVDNEVVCPPNDYVVVDVLGNDFSFLATIDVNSLSTNGLQQPSNGSININIDGTITYTPNPGWSGIDTFQYSICSQEYPDLCDLAYVYVSVTNCNATPNENLVQGYVYLEQITDDGVYNGEARKAGILVHLIGDANCNGSRDGGELIIETKATDASGAFEFSTINGEFVRDEFDDLTTLDDGDFGSLPWKGSWSEIGTTNGFATDPVRVATDAADGDRALFISEASKGASRQVTFSGATTASLSFEFRRMGLDNEGEELQVRFNGQTIYVIHDGNGIGTNPYYFPVNVNIPYANIIPNGDNTLQFVTNATTGTGDYYIIDNVEVVFNKAQVCFVVEADVSDQNEAYEIAALDEAAMSFSALGSCNPPVYLGVLANIIANDNSSSGEVNQPQLVDILPNDIGIKNPGSVVITDPPSNGTVNVNPDGTVTYTPNPNYEGSDDFDYQVCSVDDPLVCDIAKVDVSISCRVLPDSNVVAGSIFNDFNENGIFDAGEALMEDVSVLLYEDADQNGVLEGAENTPLATQLATGGSYNFDIKGPYGPVTNFNKSVSLGVDDAHEKDDGSVDLNNNKLEINSSRLYAGMRFQNINIPKDAKIISAYITFTASDDRSGAASFEISIQDDDLAQAFSSNLNDIKNRWSGPRKISWNNVPDWSKDNQYNTPSLVNMVQHLVDRGDWNSGDNMLFIVKWLTGERKARSFNQSASVAPKLVITYQVVDYPKRYVTKVDLSSLPYGGRVTTAQEQIKTFTFLNESFCNANFGVARNTTAAVNDVNVTFQNMPVSGNVMRNDIDIEGSQGFFGSYLTQFGATPENAPIQSGAALSGISYNGSQVANAGSLQFDAVTGDYTFTPATDFAGNVELRYTKCDGGLPAVCDTGSLKIMVNRFPNPNDLATNITDAINDYNVSYGRTVKGNLLKNDADPEKDAIAMTTFRMDIQGNGLITALYNNNYFISGVDEFGDYWDKAGQFRLSQSGDYIFTPFTGFIGTVYVTYTICDDVKEPYKACDQAKLIIEVMLDKTINGNDAPFAGDDYLTALMQTPATGNWVTNDGDDNSDQIRINESNVNVNPLNPGTSTQVLSTKTTQQGGTVVFYKNGTYQYTPPTGYYGPDQLGYRICDAVVSPKCDSATIYLLVAPMYIDYGDLPAHFPTAANLIPVDFDIDGIPDMPISTWFGQIVDAEVGHPDTYEADGDDNNGMSDEDGLVLPAWEGRASEDDTVRDFKIIVNGTDPGMTVYYGLWIDWDFDGVFDEFHNGSAVTNDWALRNQDTTIVQITLPANAVRSTVVGIRLRAFQAAPTADMFGGRVRSGEVEDYKWALSTILPVELSYFEAEANGNDAELTWQTLSEVNNDYFSVQRSKNAATWEEVGIVEGHGNSSEAHDYDLTDANLAAGRYYYRLQQFDFDGSFEFSEIRSVLIDGSNTASARAITLYPVPVHAQGTIHVDGLESEQALIRVYALNGSKAVYDRLSGNAFELSALQLNAGVYIIEIEDGAFIHSEKIIVYE